MHSQYRIFNGHAISIAHFKTCCLQLLFVALSLSVSTSLTGQCPPTSLQCSNINHSLNPATCTGSLTVDDVIGNNMVSPNCNCEVTILDEHDNIIPNDFDLNDAGETFRYQLCCDGVCCWAEVSVEFYGNAQFACQDGNVEVTSSCIEMDILEPPLVDLNGSPACIEPEVILLNEIENIVDCDNGIQRQLIRTFTIVSPQGPSNEICTQTINVEAADLDGNITFPPKATINCDQEPTPDITGAPFFTTTINGALVNIPLVPGSLPADCSVFVNFEDTSFPNACGRMIQREWTIVQWACDSEEMFQFTQAIDVTDLTNPTIVCPPAIVSTTTTFDCRAAITFAPAEISDNCTNPLSVSISPGNINNNGGIGLFTESFTAVYTVEDCAMNTATCTVDVTIIDMTPPVAICEDDIIIGFAGTGSTYLDAYTIDAGSFDDCSDNVTFMIARRIDGVDTPDHMFMDRIEILCEDVGNPFPVILQVSDGNGNVNFCWVLVTVTIGDNLVPTLICPEDEVVSCDIVFDPDSLNLFFNPFSLEGDPCLSGFTIQDILLDELNSCGVGERRRRIRLFNADGVRVSNQCFQTITFASLDPFEIDRADFPEDVCIPANVCTPEEITDFDFELDIEMMPCQLIGINTTLEEVMEPFFDCSSPNTQAICQQFVRTWTVVNWCAFDGEMGAKSDPFVFEQIININENTDPTIVARADREFCLPLNNCDELFIAIDAPNTSDNCSDDVNIEYQITKNNEPSMPRQTGAEIRENLPVGSYQLVWFTSDRCGNQSNVLERFTVVNCKAPTITCVTGLVLPILPVDTDGDDKPDVNQALLEIKHVLAFAGNACDLTTDPIVSFDDTNLVESVTFSCADAASGEPISVDLYARDLDDNQSKCTTTIALSDNGLCPEMPANRGLLSVSGNIRTSSSHNINGVDVLLQGSTDDISTVTSQGLYAFDNMPSGGSYVIKPQKEDDYLLGVSISDMILIQQHILGIKEITDPYVMLAADVNLDGKISITDLIMLQRATLGLIDKPADDESWLFVNAESSFFDPTNPLRDDPPTLGYVSSLEEDEVQDFIGIKYGDINGDALSRIENRSQWDMFLETNEMTFEEDKVYNIPFYLSDQITDLRGFNFELNVSDATLIDIDTRQFASTTITSDLSKSKVKVIAVSSSEMLVDPSIPLFTLQVRGPKDATLSDALIGSKLTVARLTTDELIEKDVHFRMNKSVINESVKILPNPWYDMTTIQMTVESKTNASIFVTDISGKVIFENEYRLIKGLNTIELRSEAIEQAGLYVVQVNTATTQQTIKMIKLD